MKKFCVITNFKNGTSNKFCFFLVPGISKVQEAMIRLTSDVCRVASIFPRYLKRRTAIKCNGQVPFKLFLKGRIEVVCCGSKLELD